jgi:hypothetical protein
MCTHFKEKKEKESSCVYRFWSHAGPKLRGRLPTKRRERKKEENQVKHFKGTTFSSICCGHHLSFFFFCEE